MRSALVVVALCLSGEALAHPLAPAVVSFEAVDQERVVFRFRQPLTRPVGERLSPVVPSECVAVGAPEVERGEVSVTEVRVLRCRRSDLAGSRITVSGIESSSLVAVVRLIDRSGRSSHALLHDGNRTYTVPSRISTGATFLTSLSLGIEHMLTGWDHVVFVLALVVFFGWRRRLLAAITAFTIGHSTTLALVSLGLLSVPPVWAEVLIALSILVLALELVEGGDSPLWRHPWTIPAATGLVHGLGFASVMFAAGVPVDAVPLTLLGFNVGLEIAQLVLVVVAALGGFALLRSTPESWHSKAIPAQVFGALAVYWLIERVFASVPPSL